jgi:DGQHR domain-containing protein
MKKDRELLEIELSKVITEIKSSVKSVHKINNQLTNFNIGIGTFNEIIKGERKLSELEIPLLCLISLTLFEQTGNKYISPDDYFTENEIIHSKSYFMDNSHNDNEILPIVFKDVIMLDYQSYVTKIDLSFLVKLFDAQLITYDYETQRSAKYKRLNDGGVVPTPDVNLRSVKDIAAHMLNETYLPDTLTLNVYSDEMEPLVYNEKTRTLTINDEAVISILDGFHRLQAARRAFSINNELILEMILSIRSYDSETAKKYFGQINTVNIVPKERLRELKSEKPSDIVVRDLNMKSDLTGKIASASRISEIADQLTTFDVLSYAINKVFNPKTKMEAKEVSNYLVDFFNYLVGSFVDEFLLNPSKYRDSLINHPLMFAAYVQVAKNFQENNIKLIEIKNYINNIEFNNQELVEILKDKRGYNNKKNRDNVIDYFASRGGVLNVK